jgi:hypothetical protein
MVFLFSFLHCVVVFFIIQKSTKQCKNNEKTPQNNVGMKTKTPQNNVRIKKNTTKQNRNANKNNTKQCRNNEKHHSTM